MCVPSGITNVESNAVIDVAIASGARKGLSDRGAGLPLLSAHRSTLEKPNGNLIVDIGGGTDRHCRPFP